MNSAAWATVDTISRERLAERVGAAAYGTVLVLGALSVIGVSDVALGHGAEIVAGVGAATWIAHLFAQVLERHVRYLETPGLPEVRRAAIDGSPILLSCVLPAFVVMLGRFDVIGSGVARLGAIGVATAQLLAVGVVVARFTRTPHRARWTYAAATVAIGLVVAAATVLLGH